MVDGSEDDDIGEEAIELVLSDGFIWDTENDKCNEEECFDCSTMEWEFCENLALSE